MNTRPMRSVTLLALLSLPVAAPALDLDCRHTSERRATLDAAGATRVEIVARADDLTVQPAAGGSLLAEGRACASSPELLEQIQLRTQREGDVLRVYAQMPGEMKGIGLFYATLDLVVSVPADLPVDVTDSSGDATLDRVHLARVHDSSGDILARNVSGDFEIEDSSGDVRVEQAQGKVSIRDSSGDIVVQGASGVHVVVDSSGDIDIARVAGDVLIEQDSSGDIAIAGVGGNVAVLADGSGQLRVSDARGTVKLP
jgi:Putative adhesin